MKVYVLVESWQLDSGECGEIVSVFDTVEKAKKVFLESMECARQDLKSIETEEENYYDGDMTWRIWEKEEYCYNHIDLVIYEREVE